MFPNPKPETSTRNPKILIDTEFERKRPGPTYLTERLSLGIGSGSQSFERGVDASSAVNLRFEFA
jgi:hypothetical protein